jgi:hypothetical protein
MVFRACLRSILSGAVLLLGFSAAQVAFADEIPYPNIGSYNVVTYSFTAAFTGDIVAYFVGGIHADYENKLGLLVNGVDTGIYGLDNHTSNIGDSLDFGSVSAGASLVFVLQNLTLGASAYSDPSLNPPYDAISGSPNPLGNNHIYATTYTATSPFFPGVPTGPYVAFEDIPFPTADFNYDNESFVFTNRGGDIRGSGAGVRSPVGHHTWIDRLDQEAEIPV